MNQLNVSLQHSITALAAHGWSRRRIARELDLSGPAVLTRLFRARRQLRAACGEDTTLDPQE